MNGDPPLATDDEISADVQVMADALRAALRVMNEQYFAVVHTLRQNGITLNSQGQWQKDATDNFVPGTPIQPDYDLRVAMAEELRQARAQARKAIGRKHPPDGG